MIVAMTVVMNYLDATIEEMIEETTADQEETIVADLCIKKNVQTDLDSLVHLVLVATKGVVKALMETDRNLTEIKEVVIDHLDEMVAEPVNLVSTVKLDHLVKTE